MHLSVSIDNKILKNIKVANDSWDMHKGKTKNKSTLYRLGMPIYIGIPMYIDIPIQNIGTHAGAIATRQLGI